MWPIITSPVDCIIFDCDSTISMIEGVNYLAELNNVLTTVAEQTEHFMSSGGMDVSSYAARLDLIQPSHAQCLQLTEYYYQNRTPQVDDVFRILQHLAKSIFVVSAGIQPSVALFAEKLGLTESQVFAVNCYFDDNGNYRDFDRDCPLIYSDGKREVVQNIVSDFSSIVYVGDGQNDLAAVPLVDYFIGFGGVAKRPVIAEAADYYITDRTLAVLLPLILFPQEILQLNHEDQAICDAGLQLLSKL